MKKTTYFLLSLLLMCCWQLPCYGQQATISGTLVNEEEKGLSYANVLLLSAKDSSLVKGAVSDATGKYLLERLAPGNYLLQVRMLGYATPALLPVALQESKQQLQIPSLQLEPLETEMAAVEVKATRPFIVQEADKTIINVENSLVSAGNTALEVLEKAPGVVYDRQNEALSVRGKQGVLVLIDGRQTFLPASEVVAMLQNMPASNVASIEILTNPPARYAAEGNAGLINIQLKKNKDYGTNLSVTSTLAMGYFPKYAAGLSLNNRQERYNLFFSYNYGNSRSRYTNNIIRKVAFEGTTTVLDQQREVEASPSSHIVKLGSDLFLTKKSTLGFVLNGYVQQEGGEQQNTTLLKGLESQTDIFDAVPERESTNITANVHYLWDIIPQKQQLSLDLDWVRFDRRQQNSYEHQLLDNAGSPLMPNEALYSDNRVGLSIYSLKANYIHTLSPQASLEGGLSVSNVPLSSSLDFQELLEGTWQQDPWFTNDFSYDEMIEAAYLTYKGSRGPWQLQAGLRGEYTSALGVSEKEEKVVNRDYFKLFPTLFLTRKLGEQTSLQFSYSKRIDRPFYQDLNPFVYFVSYYTHLKGNPFLNPQYTHNVQLSYTHKSGLILTGSLSRTLERMTHLPMQNDESKIEMVTPYNLDNFDNASLTASYPLQPVKFWNINTNLNVFHNRFRYEYLGGQLDNRQTSVNFSTTHTFTAGKGWKAEATGIYKSPMAIGLNRSRSQWNIDAGISKSLLKERASVKLLVTDIFNTNRFRSNIRYQNMDISFNSRWESRQLRLLLSYRIGNERVKVNQNRKTSAQEQQQRIGG